MKAEPQRITVTVYVTNREALAALADVVELLEDLAEDWPWKPEIKQAVERLDYALNHLTIQP